LSKVAARLTSLLAKIQKTLSNDVELSQKVGFRMGCNDRSRLAKVQEFKGPDPDTTKVLNDNHHHWFQDPSAFWILPSPLVTDSTNPEVKIVGRFLQTNLSDA
jgi:hypothetical protein